MGSGSMPGMNGFDTSTQSTSSDVNNKEPSVEEID
jgi:hypothetical protein